MDDYVFGFEELEVWKKARAFKVEIADIVKYFPLEEKYKLKDQLIRSSRSITALIAEGHGRFSYPDQIHYCVQARGSLSETVNHLLEAFDAGYLTVNVLIQLKMAAKEIQRLINGYIIYLRNKLKCIGTGKKV